MSDAATGAGLMAALIAVCGFLAHVKPALAGRTEAELRRSTVVGGLWGCVATLAIAAISQLQ
jgi:hypothetical protein